MAECRAIALRRAPRRVAARPGPGRRDPASRARSRAWCPTPPRRRAVRPAAGAGVPSFATPPLLRGPTLRARPLRSLGESDPRGHGLEPVAACGARAAPASPRRPRCAGQPCGFTCSTRRPCPARQARGRGPSRSLRALDRARRLPFGAPLPWLKSARVASPGASTRKRPRAWPVGARPRWVAARPGPGRRDPASRARSRAWCPTPGDGGPSGQRPARERPARGRGPCPGAARPGAAPGAGLSACSRSGFSQCARLRRAQVFQSAACGRGLFRAPARPPAAPQGGAPRPGCAWA
jgi:hypothetical protein